MQQSPLEIQIRKIIKENNSLTYFSEEDRFPNKISIEKTLKSWEIPFEEEILVLLLWVMAFSYVIIAVSFIEKPQTFNDYHFIDSTYTNIVNIKEYFYNKISLIYKEIYGKIFTEKNLQNILFIDPMLYNFKNQNEYLLYQYARIFEILKEFLEKIDRDQDFMNQTEILKRKQYAIHKLKEKYKLIISEKQNLKEKEQNNISEEKEKIVQRRAVDDPRWKKIEKSPHIDWDMVFRTFGPNMVIRILLRRQDYELLKKMIEEKKIYKSRGLKIYIRRNEKNTGT
ncbi:MAG: hypothetical protein KatS3mg129_1702 [Leptospiraceae bacterium]|nr:MAG: hypothetical protein KatS3mg129_1702 [Leptospiraceae bacterium]